MAQEQQSAMTPDNIPEEIPILPLFDVVLFPKMLLPLAVMQQESIQLIDEAMSKDRIIGAVTSKKSDPQSEYGAEDLYSVGTSAVSAKPDPNTASPGTTVVSRPMLSEKRPTARFDAASATTDTAITRPLVPAPANPPSEMSLASVYSTTVDSRTPA